MEDYKSLAIGSIVASLSTILAYIIKINHKKLRSKCCNKSCESSIDVDETTPKSTPNINGNC